MPLNFYPGNLIGLILSFSFVVLEINIIIPKLLRTLRIGRNFINELLLTVEQHGFELCGPHICGFS